MPLLSELMKVKMVCNPPSLVMSNFSDKEDEEDEEVPDLVEQKPRAQVWGNYLWLT